MTRTFTHPDVFTRGVQEGWAEDVTDPAQIDWPARQARAAISFEVVDGRPVNPCEQTGIRYGRNELGHWGEQLCADAVVLSTDEGGCRWLILVERSDGHGWALPGGYVEDGEDPKQAGIRELAEETGLNLSSADWWYLYELAPARYVPDPRASDESWMVTVPVRTHLGTIPRSDMPALAGADDAKQAVWMQADTYEVLVDHIEMAYEGQVFAAHKDMLRELFG